MWLCDEKLSNVAPVRTDDLELENKLNEHDLLFKAEAADEPGHVWYVRFASLV